MHQRVSKHESGWEYVQLRVPNSINVLLHSFEGKQLFQSELETNTEEDVNKRPFYESIVDLLVGTINWKIIFQVPFVAFFSGGAWGSSLRLGCHLSSIVDVHSL